MLVVAEPSFDWTSINSFVDMFAASGIIALSLIVLSVLLPWGSYKKIRYATGVLLFWDLVPLLPVEKSLVFLPNYLIITAVLFMLVSVVAFGKKVAYCTGLGFFSSFVVIGLFAGMTIEPIASYSLNFIHYLVSLIGFIAFIIALTSIVFIGVYMVQKMLMIYNAVCTGVECSRTTLGDFWRSFNKDTLPFMLIAVAFIFTSLYFFLTSEYKSMFVVTAALYLIIAVGLIFYVIPLVDEDGTASVLIFVNILFLPFVALINALEGAITHEDAVIVFAIHGLIAILDLIVSFVVGIPEKNTQALNIDLAKSQKEENVGGLLSDKRSSVKTAKIRHQYCTNTKYSAGS
jgi:hypothetical protein